MNNDKIFSIRLNLAMVENNLKQVDLCNKTGIGKSAMSQYLSGSFVPKNDRIYLLAKTLNVSPEWLIGYDSEKQPEPKPSNVISISDPMPLDIDPAARQLLEERKVLASKTNKANLEQLKQMNKIMDALFGEKDDDD
jgi:transcriptional regulator with XRE-family HTH domain